MFRRKILFSILLILMKKVNEHEFVFLNKKPELDGNAIYVFNHSCKYDASYACQVISSHAWILGGKQRLQWIDRLILNLNGTIWVDRHNKESKKKAFTRMLHKLKKGNNLLMFPEGTWNLEPSLPMMKLYWGCIKLSQISKCPIVPVVMEYIEEKVFIRYGNVFLVKSNDFSGEVEQLRDMMATLRWEIWESFPVVKRCTLVGNEWDLEKKRRIAQYPKLDYEYEQSVILRNN